MEALTAVGVAALTVYDMCKAVDRGMVTSAVRLVAKSGGKSGSFDAPEDAVRVAEAHARVIAGFSPLPAEMVSLADAAGRVLATTQGAPHPAASPRRRWMAMRYAPRTCPPAPTTSRSSAVAAGGRFAALQPGEAVRIFTGAPVPEGADTVVIQEDTEAQGDKITILGAAARRGTSARPGWTSTPATRASRPAVRSRPRDVALAAAMNIPWLSVRRRPRVAILSTGDELVRRASRSAATRSLLLRHRACGAGRAPGAASRLLLDIARDDARGHRTASPPGAQRYAGHPGRRLGRRPRPRPGRR